MKINLTDTVFKVVVLIISIAAGWILFPFIANLLIYMGLYPENAMDTNFGPEMIQKAVFIWFGSTIISIAYLFVKTNIRYFFLLLPVFAPSLFGIIYALAA